MLIEWYAHQMELLHIDLRMNTAADASMLQDYDEVIVSTGAAPRKLNLPGLTDSRVMEAIDYLRGQETGETVVVIGGGLTGVELAYDLARKGKKPVIVEMQKDILQVPGLCAANSNMLREILRYYEIPVLTSTSLLGIQEQNGLKVRVQDENGSERLIEADNCILSVGYIPVRTLEGALKKAGVPQEKIHVIGDAHEVGNLMTVIHEAYELCYTL